MKVTFALAYLRNEAVTGGILYNRELSRSWAEDAEVSLCDVRMRFFQWRLAGPAWIAQHFAKLRSDWIVQAASSGYHSAWIIRFARRFFAKTRHLGIVHHPRWLENSVQKVDEVRFYNEFDRLLSISEHVKSEMIRAGVYKPIDVLYPGYVAPSCTVPSSNDPLRIIWNGHLIERKGALVLLDALGQLDPSINWSAEFIAASCPDGDYSARFHERFSQLDQKVGSRVQFSTRLPNEAFMGRLGQAGVFCLPSRVEGYSIATVEAMAQGCVPVVPFTENFCELLGSAEYPGLFHPCEPGALAALLSKLLIDSQIRAVCSSMIQQRLCSLPTWETFRSNARDYLQTL